MELSRLVAFEAVARLGGFTRAAEHLHLAQPAVSARVKALERELGVLLLHRTTRRVELTRAGELVLVRTRRVLDELAALRADTDEITAAVTGRVRIGSVEAAPMLPAALRAFHLRHPGVDVELRSGRRAALLADLDADRIDLAVSALAGPLPARFATAVLAVEELVLVTEAGHPVRRHLADVRDEPFACLPADSGLRALLDGAAAAAGFTARVRFEATSLARVRELVAAGLGVALMARSAAEAPGPPVAVHALTEPVERPVALVHRTDRPLPAAARALRASLLDR